MPLGVAAFQVMRVIGGDQRKVQLLGHLDQRLVHKGLFGNNVGLYFQEEIILAHYVAVEPRAVVGRFDVILYYKLRYLAAEAGGGANQPLAVTREQFMVYSRFVIETVCVGDRDQLCEVIVALFVLGEQYQVVLALSLAAGMSVRVHVDLAAEYRLNSGLVALIVKFHAAEHDSVVCQRDGVHPHVARRRGKG